MTYQMESRAFRAVFGLLLTTTSIACVAMAETIDVMPTTTKFRVYVGTYTTGESRGIYHCEFDARDGALSLIGLAAAAENPTFLAHHPGRSTLYAVSEVADYADTNGGAVSAFSVDPSDGTLKLLNIQPSGGAGPCHITLDRTGRHLLVANYGTGSVAVLPISGRGELGPLSSTFQHEGSSVNPDRQAGPHAHSINLDPQNRFAFAADLGLDKVMVYKFHAATGTLEPNDPPHVSLGSGAGPRHFTFHPSGKWAYVINELHSTITTFKYDLERGALENLETVSTLPEGLQVANTTAEIQIHPSGRFLFGSNRGHDSIAMFAIHADTGLLTPLGHHPSGGRTPRNFVIDPTGKFLLAAQQDSDSVVVHRIDRRTGQLELTEHAVPIPAPVCVRFLVP